MAVIDCSLIAEKIYTNLKEVLGIIQTKHHLIPGLAIIMIGDNPASEIYIRNKIKKCDEIGLHHFLYKISDDIHQATLIHKIDQINFDPKIHGVILQLPLPKNYSAYEIIEILNPEKDVDGLHPLNLGKLMLNADGLKACTALACMEVLHSLPIELSGMHAVVVGRSNIVGKPVAQCLIEENCTVTMCHSQTKYLKIHTLQADIIISAAGSIDLIKADMIKENAIILDVGINRINEKKICGDVDFAAVSEKASFTTKVPGGIGILTVACLIRNTIIAALKQKHIKYEFDFQHGIKLL